MATEAMKLGQKVCSLLNLDPKRVAKLSIIIDPWDVIRVNVEMLPATGADFDDLVLGIVGLPDTVVQSEADNGAPA